MPVPVAQAGPDQAYPYSSLPKQVTLSGGATNTPILTWEWTMLSVPVGSSANVGTNDDFVNGSSASQNPQFTCDVPGGYVLGLRAKNASGWSVPAVDREVAQTAIYILTQKLSLKIPGAYLYRYDTDLNETLLELENVLTDHVARHENGGTDELSVAGLSGVLADAQNADKLLGRTIASTAPSDGDVYKWNASASEWQPDTGGGGGNNMVAMALNENTDSSSSVVVGALGLLDTFLADLNVAFAVTAYVTASGLTGTVELYNLTDSVSVKTLTFTELISTRKTSTSFALASGTKIYEVRIKVSGGGSSADRVVCMWAGLEGSVP